MAERNLVLAGGGHAHVEVLRQIALRPIPGWRVTLVTREFFSPYSGMLPGVAAGLYRPEQALIDARALAARAGATLVVDRVTGLDPDARLLRRADGAPLPYDLLSIDTGATPDTSRVPGASEHAVPLKPIDGLLARLDGLFAEAEGGQTVAVVGGGAAGCEMALALDARLGPRGVRVVLVAGTGGVLARMPDAAGRRMAQALAERGVTLRSGADVTQVTATGLLFRDAPPVAADVVLWATGAAAAPWLGESGLRRDARGFLLVGPTLQAVDRPEVFAAGDVASLLPEPLPKAGVFAVRQGPVLAANLRAAAEGRPLSRYAPQKEWLVLLSLGDGRAIGTRNGLVFAGRWVWWWKDWIDRRFMARYQGSPP